MDSTNVQYRQATSADVPAMESVRAPDVESGPADPRMAKYLDGEHHPQKALAPRVMYVATKDESVVGYIGGHLSRRFELEGELQYLYVKPECRRTGIAKEMLRLLARWFGNHGAKQVCAGADEEDKPTRAFLESFGAKDLGNTFYAWSDIGQVLAEI